MRFFQKKSWRTDHIPDTRTWWKENRSLFISSSWRQTHETSLLIAHLDALNQQDKWSSDDKWDLYIRMRHWHFIHEIEKKQSKRSLLASALEVKIYKELQQPKLEALFEKINRRIYPANVYINHITIPGLSEWWLKQSALSFFKPRSQSTKTLDRAIKWLSHNYAGLEDITGQKKAIYHVLQAIMVWEMDRASKSERQYHVDLLKKICHEKLQALSRDTSFKPSQPPLQTLEITLQDIRS